ncbi:MAG: hypothetical protein PQ612_09140 [Rickettsiales bacterium]|nr:hypothetical protein [Pseudomonadota bacterium]MDA0967201.1 hypothetical protein [Pseudomonadota bacterium]MDG4544138.1 hypothetical protein [Rickettsiales bacterium]MDG4546319.1 hypothetical protein [Rickettsiales bacterium]MDG4548462.1 hypothetical protein [Rickettsiales bacterium]
MAPKRLIPSKRTKNPRKEKIGKFFPIEIADGEEDFLKRPVSPILPVSDISDAEETVEQLNNNMIQDELKLVQLLLKATKESNVGLANKIIDSENFNTRVTDENGNIPLHFIAGYDQPEVTKKILEKDKESICVQNSHGNMPLHFSTFNDKNENTELFIDELLSQNKGNVILLPNKYGHTATHYSESHTLIKAAQSNEIEEAKKAYSEGAIINFQDNEGCTALHYSTCNGNLSFTEFLLQNNAEKDMANNKKQTPKDLVPIDKKHRFEILFGSYGKEQSR